MPEIPPSSPEKFYVTTPIYYVNARPHIGHAYTTIAADVLARRHRLLGDDTFFLTGTDEHGQKIERSARAAGTDPQRFADQVSASFRSLWDRMGITYTDFIRTTEPRHKQRVQHLFRALQDRGAIYKNTYTGQYCVHDESYVEGPPGIRCPDCGRTTETVSEENYYFKLSEYQRPLLDLIEPGPNGEPPQLQIQPDSRRNEVLSFLRGNAQDVLSKYRDKALFFDDEDLAALPHGTIVPSTVSSVAALTEALRDGALSSSAAGHPYVPGALKDLSISRTSFSWGIPVPGDPKHVIYVWLDALANYMTAVGYGSDAPADQELFKKFWPADLHLVGKEIIRFHCVYWPAFLLALNPANQLATDAVSSRPERSEVERPAITPATVPFEVHKQWAERWLPKAVTAHGWLLFEESKMSKSRGNIVRTETILDAFGDHYRKGLGDYNTQQLKKDPAFQSVPEPSAHDCDLFASDVLRYFLLREIPFGQDGSFSFDALYERFNSDLVNGYGNLVFRTTNLIQQNFDGAFDAFPVEPWLCVDKEIVRSDGGTTHAHVGTAFLINEVEKYVASADLWYRDSIALHSLVDEFQMVARTVDGYLSYHRPWILAKVGGDTARQMLREVLYTAAESIRILTALLYPILPFSTARVWAQLGLGGIEHAARNGELKDLQWGGLQPGTPLGALAPIFPRAPKELAQIMTDMEANTPRIPARSNTLDDLTTVIADNDARTSEGAEFAQAPLATELASPAPHYPAPSRFSNETTSGVAPESTNPSDPGAPPRTSGFSSSNPIAEVGGSSAPVPDLIKTPSHTEAQASGLFAGSSSSPMAQAPSDASAFAPQFAPQITIDDFIKVDLRVAKIIIAERIPKADKLLRLEVDLGSETRQILSGIAEWYTPEELLGRRIIVIANLAPRTMRGLESHGMLLAASTGEGGKPILATFAEGDDIASGARLK